MEQQVLGECLLLLLEATMNGELSLEEAKRLAQARLDLWRTEEHELVVERRRAAYNMALTASPTTRGEQIILAIELDESTSTWALSNEA